ncbi:MAG: tryptophan synthase subunit alpha [Pseudomonadota bacterium]
MTNQSSVSNAISESTQKPALVPFLTAGYPNKAQFVKDLVEASEHAAVVEVGVPFSDPMADGVTIQQSSRVALDGGATLAWIFEAIKSQRSSLQAPVMLMSYLNPLLAYGYDDLVQSSLDSGVAGFIVPDLPLEESMELAQVLDSADLALVQLVTPVTPEERLQKLCQQSTGFVYAVTMTGITGSAIKGKENLNEYLDLVRTKSSVPVCAGFGIATAADVSRLEGHADGAVVGTALIKAVGRGERPGDFLKGLRP